MSTGLLYGALDDSDSDDDLSMFQPSRLSQSSTASTPRTSPEQQHRKQPRTESPLDSVADEKQNQDREEQMQREINRMDIPTVGSTSLLRWEIGRGKNKGYAFPCMVITNHDEAKWFYEKVNSGKELVRCLRVNSKERKLDQVPKRYLVAYNADNREGGEDAWSEKYMAMFRKKLKKKGNLTDRQRQLEEIYLSRVLASTKEIERSSMKQPPPNSSPSTVVTNREQTSDVDDDDAELKAFCDTDVDRDTKNSSPIVSPFAESHKKEQLKAGDIIAYYKPGTCFGRGVLVESQVFEVRARDKNRPLELQRDVDCLPPFHQVKRIQTMRRGKLVPLENPLFRPIESYKLMSSTLAQHHRSETETERLGAVLERTINRTKAALKKDGLEAYSDMLMSVPKRPEKKRQRESESKRGDEEQG